MIKSIISYAFSRLNDTNNGAKKFETFCQNLIPIAIDENFLPASGQDAGGDGGIDGWSFLGESQKIKYAFSINAKPKSKLQEEIKKTNFSKFSEIRFLTNQPIKEKDKQSIYNSSEYHDKKITIYDIDNLIEFVEKYENLGQFIDLPWIRKNITIAYLQKHNQLLPYKERISTYIPRSISYWNKESKEWAAISLVEYCSNLPSFTLLQAPAGFGKTCALQQLHQKILNKEVDINLPPVFISLSSYVPTTLNSIIKDRMSESNDFYCNDYLLLLDGFDEIRDADKESFVKELIQLVDNKSIIRKVIISVRENTYNLSVFNFFNEIQIALLNELTPNDIRKLFENEKIDSQAENLFFSDPFFNNFSKNIFYVIKLIDYYKEKHYLAENEIDLFDFIIQQEMNNLFRNTIPSVRDLESMALFMTLNQINEIDNSIIMDKIKLNLPMNPFSFSHKSIQEYFAAKLIATQSINEIKRIFAKGNLIIPYLTNTFGFVLNIINSTVEGQKKFKDLVSWTLLGLGNAKRLLQIESDKISKEMNNSIFKKVIDQESTSGDLFNQPESLVPFGLRDDCVDENINYLVMQIISCKDKKDKHHYFSSVLQRITNSYLSNLDSKYQKNLINFLNELLNSECIKQNKELIESLLYSISYFPILKIIENEDIYSLVNELLKIDDSENIINNLCQLLLTSEKNIDIELYIRIYDYILNKVLVERGQMAHTVPTQTTDNTYNEPLKVTYWHSFIPLTSIFISKNSSIVWDIMDYTILNHIKVIDRHSSSAEFKELFKVLFDAISIELETKAADPKIKEILINWIINDYNAYVDSELWIFLTKCTDSDFLLEIAKEVITKAGRTYFNRNIMEYFLNHEIITIEKFNWFQGEFDTKNESLKSFYEAYCYWIKEEHPIYNYVMEHISDELRDSVVQSRAKHEEYLIQTNFEEETSKLNYNIAFTNEALKDEVTRIADSFENDDISKDDFWEVFHKGELNKRNRFAIYLFQSSFWAGKNSINGKQILDNLDEENWNKDFMTYLLQYCSRNNIDINELPKIEKQKIIEWVILVLKEYPLDSIKSPLKYIHITLSHVLRNSLFISFDNEPLSDYRECLIGLIFSSFPNVVDGAFIVNSDSYSIDYLDQYLSPKRIISLITNNFEEAFSFYQKMISICGYLLNHLDEMFAYQKNIIKNYIKIYIERNIAGAYYPVITECAFALGFSIIEIQKELLADSFVIDENGSDLAHNYASSFIRYQSHKNSSSELIHLSETLLIAFNDSKDDFHKKTLAEYYIKFNEMAGDIFVFYANYLLKDETHNILNQLIHGGSVTPLKTADIQHLDLVNKLFLYSRAKKDRSDRRDGILSIALSSYKAIAERSIKSEDLDLLKKNIIEMAEEGYLFLYRHLQEIENEFAERTYKPLSIKEIINL